MATTPKMATQLASGNAGNPARLSCCEACGTRLAYDQRYCVECGEPRGPLPLAIAELIGVVPRAGPDQANDVAGVLDESPAAPASDSPEAGSLSDLSPTVSGIAVMALLAFGVFVGSALSPAQQGRAAAPIAVAFSPSKAGSNRPLGASSPTPPPSTVPSAIPAQTNTPSTTPASTMPTGSAKNPHPSETSGKATTQTLPPIKHVFLIVLSDQGFNTAFGPSSQATYLSKTLTRQGELLDNYYAVAGGELANEIALISGQGPTPQTEANCPLYTDITPGTLGAQGQVLGSGCVYPRQALTLADQLAHGGKGLRAYVEGIAGRGVSQQAICRHPALGSADAEQTPSLEHPYVTWRDPFAYFHTVIDSTACTSSIAGLDQLAPDLKTANKTPSLAYIVPDRCHDGSDQPCAPGQSSSLAAAEAFLRTVVPEIERSPAYANGGLIAITFDQAPRSGPNADSSGCCITAPYPNLPRGTTGTSGTTGTTGTTAATGATGTTTTTDTIGATPVAGGRVGLLLISKYVKPGSINVTGDYNHFSLLASIEDLFGQSHLGYAGTRGLLVFDTSVYSAYK